MFSHIDLPCRRRGFCREEDALPLRAPPWEGGYYFGRTEEAR